MNLKILSLILILTTLPLVSAELEIKKTSLVDTIVPEIGEPAVFEFRLTNLGETDNFRIYSLVGADFSPENKFTINSGTTKTLEVEIMPEQEILKNPGTFNFIYKIVGEKTGIQEDVLAIKILPLKDVLEINAYNIGFESDTAKVYINNRGGLPFPEIQARLHSVFFDTEKVFSLEKHDKTEFEILLDKDKTKSLTAGTYTLTADIKTYGVEERIQNTFKYAQKTDVETIKKKEGFFITKETIEKTNQGNLPIVVQTKINKNIISRMFAYFNQEPTNVQRTGTTITYTFQEEIQPAETLTIKVTTNWFYPLILLIASIIIIYLVKIYTFTDLIVRKKTTYVKTKGGEFALKIALNVKAKKFVEKIKLTDKIPCLVKVHKRFGAVEPDKIDEKNRRLEWNIDNLNPGEDRVFSYIVYSKVSPVGKFELPTCNAIYERNGKIKDAESNRVIFITKPKEE